MNQDKQSVIIEIVFIILITMYSVHQLAEKKDRAMKRNDIIKLSNGQEATIIRGDESELKNSYIVKLEDGELRVIDRETLTLAKGVSDIRGRRINRRQ